MVGGYGDRDPVVVKPAPDVRQERVIDVLDACASEKVKRLSLS